MVLENSEFHRNERGLIHNSVVYNFLSTSSEAQTFTEANWGFRFFGRQSVVNSPGSMPTYFPSLVGNETLGKLENSPHIRCAFRTLAHDNILHLGWVYQAKSAQGTHERGV